MVRIGLTTLNPLEILVTWSFSAVTYLEVSWVPWTRLGWGTITELIVRDQKETAEGGTGCSGGPWSCTLSPELNMGTGRFRLCVLELCLWFTP